MELGGCIGHGLGEVGYEEGVSLFGCHGDVMEGIGIYVWVL